jgi:hypothetical protein
MQVQAEIKFDQLLQLVRSLPKSRLKQLRREIDRAEKSEESLEELLLNGPVATEEQLRVIAENRKAINQWRTKPL